jgi:aspartate/methionine/tyrosine aminotransferase
MCGPSDEVIVPAPYWVSYPEMVTFAGARAVIVDTPSSGDAPYCLEPDALERAITPNTKLLVLCNPSNPTGAVHSSERLEALAVVLRRHPHVYVIADEIYDSLLFAPTTTSYFASLPGMFERTVTVNVSGADGCVCVGGWVVDRPTEGETICRAFRRAIR